MGWIDFPGANGDLYAVVITRLSDNTRWQFSGPSANSWAAYDSANPSRSATNLSATTSGLGDFTLATIPTGFAAGTTTGTAVRVDVFARASTITHAEIQAAAVGSTDCSFDGTNLVSLAAYQASLRALPGDSMALNSLHSPVLHNGTAQAGAASTITLAAGASATNDLYKGLIVKIYSGTGAGQTRTITGYVGSTKVATVGRTWAVNPDNTSLYAVLADQSAVLSANLGVTLAGTESGAITSSSFGAGAIDANAIATDALGSLELSAAAVTEIQSGLATAAELALAREAAENAESQTVQSV